MDDLFQVLADARRRAILQQLAEGERSAGEVHRAQAGVTFGAVSQHLKVLQRAGLVEMRQAGRYRFYQANLEALLPLRQWLDWMWDHSLERLKQLAEAEARASRGVASSPSSSPPASPPSPPPSKGPNDEHSIAPQRRRRGLSRRARSDHRRSP